MDRATTLDAAVFAGWKHLHLMGTDVGLQDYENSGSGGIEGFGRIFRFDFFIFNFISYSK